MVGGAEWWKPRLANSTLIDLLLELLEFLKCNERFRCEDMACASTLAQILLDRVVVLVLVLDHKVKVLENCRGLHILQTVRYV